MNDWQMEHEERLRDVNLIKLIINLIKRLI